MAYQSQGEVTVQPTQSGYIRLADAHSPSPELGRLWAKAWTRDVTMLTQAGQQLLSLKIPTQKPWSDDYQQYLQVRTQLSRNAQPAMTRHPDLAVGQSVASPVSGGRLKKSEKIRPFVCLHCFAGSTKLRGVERHFKIFHPLLSADQYASSFVDERGFQQICQSSQK